ncbi:MAG: uracil permease [Candidatus Dadabacteria bacterium]|nr:MAG: uracil permease [Candidatus Dadabacteria bacterium]
MLRDVILGVQMLFVAFGALTLVPLLTGLDPSVALFTAGVGTLIFYFITQRKVPVFLASSFAFIAPIQIAAKEWGIPVALGGLFAAGFVHMVMSQVIRAKGVEFIDRVLPSVVVGPVIMNIGLALAPVAVDMSSKNWPLALLSLVVAVVVAVWGRGLLALIPILVAAAVGYVAALLTGHVDFTPVREAAWFAVPDFTFPEFRWEAMLFMLPVAIAPMIEHVGDIFAVGKVAGRDYHLDPGIHRTMFSDGLATSVAALFGGPPNTTYSEVTGALALIKVFKPRLMAIAAVAAIVLAFVGKLGALLKTVPVPVMGGILILLFGMIAAVGVRTLVSARPNLNATRNLAIIAIVLVVGIGGATLEAGTFKLGGIGLSGVVGVLLHLLLPGAPEEETPSHIVDTPDTASEFTDL